MLLSGNSRCALGDWPRRRLKINTRFDGQGGPDVLGSFTVENGGSLEANNRFLIAGKMLASGNVTAVFNQNGGVVTLDAPLHLTGCFTVTSSPNAGLYNLREGAINIVTGPGTAAF